MNYLKNIIQQSKDPSYTNIPTVWIEGIKIRGFDEKISAPLATYEKPLWHSVGRGAFVSGLTNGINVIIRDDRMTRSILVEFQNLSDCVKIEKEIKNNLNELNQIVKTTSQYCELININTQIVGTLLYIRFEFSTGDASGHNMTTKSAQAILDFLLKKYEGLKYISISGNYCTDKKVSAVNGILGRGKYCVADLKIPKNICEKYLKCNPEKIVELNIKKNLIGSILAGSVRSANAHFANMLLAFYLATGQDAANIIEGSQGITYAEVRDGDLYFSVTLPNIIIGTIGNGKDSESIKKNLEKMGCSNKNSKSGENSKRFAKILSAVVLCGELSLMASQCNNGELIKSHIKIERNQ